MSEMLSKSAILSTTLFNQVWKKKKIVLVTYSKSNMMPSLVQSGCSNGCMERLNNIKNNTKISGIFTKFYFTSFEARIM